jgi:hypothetical protein
VHGTLKRHRARLAASVVAALLAGGASIAAQAGVFAQHAPPTHHLARRIGIATAVSHVIVYRNVRAPLGR